MADAVSGDFYDGGGNPVGAIGNEGVIPGSNGDANGAGAEPATNDSEPQWTSFRGNGDSGSGFSDPDTTAPAPGSGADSSAPFGRFANGKPRKRPARGTKSGGSNTTRRNAAAESVPLASLLYSSHFLLSKMIVPELELSEDESKTLGRALAEVGQYYEVPMVSPQTVAWYNLATTAAMIYGTRFVAYRNRARKEAAEQRAGNVAQMRPVHAGVM